MGTGSKGRELIASLLSYYLSFRRFSLTRWAGVTVSCGKLLRSLLVGLDCIAQIVFQLGNAEKLHGFKRVTIDVRVFCAVGTISSQPCERLALELLEDDRLLLRAPTLADAVNKDATSVAEIHRDTWVALACCGQKSHPIDVDRLASLATQCVFTSLGYLHMHMWRHLREYPLKLTQGDIPKNLADLLEADSVTEFNSQRIKAGLVLGVPQAEVVRALKLLCDAPCSTTLVEQAHKSAALLIRQHRQYKPETLTARSFVTQVAPLFSSKAVDPIAARLQKQIGDTLRQKRQYTARNHFCSKLAKDMVSEQITVRFFLGIRISSAGAQPCLERTAARGSHMARTGGTRSEAPTSCGCRCFSESPQA